MLIPEDPYELLKSVWFRNTSSRVVEHQILSCKTLEPSVNYRFSQNIFPLSWKLNTDESSVLQQVYDNIKRFKNKKRFRLSLIILILEVELT